MRRWHILFILLTILNIIDYWLTSTNLDQLASNENNILMRHLITHYGMVYVLYFKLFWLSVAAMFASLTTTSFQRNVVTPLLIFVNIVYIVGCLMWIGVLYM